MEHYSLDFETCSEADLKKVGAFRYAQDPTTRVLCASIRDDQGRKVSTFRPEYDPATLTPKLVRYGTYTPSWVDKAARGEALIHAYNAQFEWAILNYTCTRLFGWPVIPSSAMRCTAARARYWGYGGTLDETSRALGGPPKDMAGHRLMMKMARPRKRKSGISWWDLDEPDLMRELCDYCEQDTAVESAIKNKLPDIPSFEQAIFELDLRMNARGVRIDQELVARLREATEEAVTQLDKDLDAITGGEVTKTTQVAKLTKWINEQLSAAGQEMVTSLDKESMGALLDRADLPPEVRAAADCRRLAAKSSTAKLKKMQEAVCEDGMIRGALQYYGAARTGRWAGRIIQPQNLPRGAMKDPIGGADQIVSGMGDPFEVADAEGVDIMTAASSLIRSTIIPREFEDGGVILAPDYGQIEARIIAWLAGQQDVLDVFAQGKDIYTYTANQQGSNNRQYGKVIVLATGFGMGPPAFMEAAAGYGLELTPEEAEAAVYGWRDANPKIVQFWYDLEAAAWDAINAPKRHRHSIGQAVGDGRVHVGWKPNAENKDKRDLVIQLPSTRKLIYPNIRSAPHPLHGRESLCFDGLNQVTGKFERIFTYSGKLAENVTQAAARDVMALALILLDWCSQTGRIDAEPFLTVHDEAVLDVPARSANDPDLIEAVRDVMLFDSREVTRPRWLGGLPLKVDVEVKRRYSK